MAPKRTKKAIAPCCEKVVSGMVQQVRDEMDREIEKLSKKYEDEINRLYNKLREERDYSLQHEGTIKNLCKFICR
jgi:intergrase/recombinase